MIVHDGGDVWQLVLQPEHGDLTGALAAAWGNSEFAAPRSRESMVTAATRHDDGWAVWERWPEVDSGAEGAPVSFIDIDVPSHIAFYSAAVTDVTRRDPYAGLLVAMHAAGLYRMRYDTHPQMGVMRDAERYEQQIAAFLAELEDSYAARRERSGIDENQQWTDYRMLQVFDRLALYFCGFFKLANDDLHTLGPVPLDYEGRETELRIKPLSPFEPLSPTHVEISPYPFGESPARFRLKRRLLPKRPWTPAEIRRELAEGPAEWVEIVAERPSEEG